MEDNDIIWDLFYKAYNEWSQLVSDWGLAYEKKDDCTAEQIHKETNELKAFYTLLLEFAGIE